MTLDTAVATVDVRDVAAPRVSPEPAAPAGPASGAPAVPRVTRVEIDFGTGEIRRGALLGASATVQRHDADGWRALAGARVRIVFTPLAGGPAQQTTATTDCRGVVRFAARHHDSGTWSVHVETDAGTPCSAARLVVVHD